MATHSGTGDRNTFRDSETILPLPCIITFRVHQILFTDNPRVAASNRNGGQPSTDWSCRNCLRDTHMRSPVGCERCAAIYCKYAECRMQVLSTRIRCAMTLHFSPKCRQEHYQSGGALGSHCLECEVDPHPGGVTAVLGFRLWVKCATAWKVSCACKQGRPRAFAVMSTVIPACSVSHSSAQPSRRSACMAVLVGGAGGVVCWVLARY